LGGLVLTELANRLSFAEPGISAAAPSGAVVFETVRTDGLAHLSYLIGDRSSGHAAVLDPRRDVDVYLELARQHRLTIMHAVETHIHADFVSGSRELAARTGTAKVHVSVEGGAHYGFAHEPLRDGSRLELGAVTLTALHTPGHTPEHMAYLATEKGHPWGYFSGDFLFADSVGRPDLLGAAQTPGLARALFRSLRTALAPLPDALPLYPAHGAGSPCGANIGDRQSTLGHERRHNPGLRFTDESAFSDWVTAGLPVQGLAQLPVQELNNRLPPRDFQLLDVRTPREWDEGHLPVARYRFLGELPEKLRKLNRDQPVVVYCASGYRSSLAASLLQASGFRKVLNVPGSYMAWTAAGFPVVKPPDAGRRASDTER
jgi:glyoxylase-like metal-dependent hydrolase (beta-lactamase superfamily II)/rhodanese-related sulfurtransferase